MQISVSINGTTKDFDLKQRPIIIGRSNTCDFTVAGFGTETVSSKHSILKLIDDQLTVEDLGSVNGTFVNGRKCNERTTLGETDRFQLGSKGPVVEISTRDVLASEAADTAKNNPSSGVKAFAQKRSFLVEESASAPAALTAKASVAPPVSQQSTKVDSKSTTRQMLIELKKRNRLAWLLTISAASVFVLIASGFAISSWIELSNVKDGLKNKKPELYMRCAVGTAYIWNINIANQTVGRGSGFLVKRDSDDYGYIITNHHVIEDGDLRHVWFPEIREDGSIETKQAHYHDSPGVRELEAELIGSSPSKDLALLRVDFGGRYRHATPLPLADEIPPNGTEVFTFGNPGSVKNVLWTFSNGVVKNYDPRFSAQMGGQRLDAEVLVTTNSIEPGDSGGPVVNDEGLIVAVVSNKSNNARLQNQFIAVTEVQRFIAKYVKGQ